MSAWPVVVFDQECMQVQETYDCTTMAQVRACVSWGKCRLKCTHATMHDTGICPTPSLRCLPTLQLLHCTSRSDCQSAYHVSAQVLTSSVSSSKKASDASIWPQLIQAAYTRAHKATQQLVRVILYLKHALRTFQVDTTPCLQCLWGWFSIQSLVSCIPSSKDAVA